jgi:hypothetical protein
MMGGPACILSTIRSVADVARGAPTVETATFQQVSRETAPYMER